MPGNRSASKDAGSRRSSIAPALEFSDLVTELREIVA